MGVASKVIQGVARKLIYGVARKVIFIAVENDRWDLNSLPWMMRVCILHFADTLRKGVNPCYARITGNTTMSISDNTNCWVGYSHIEQTKR